MAIVCHLDEHVKRKKFKKMSLHLTHMTLIANQFSEMHSIFIGICRSINFKHTVKNIYKHTVVIHFVESF